MSRSIRIAAVHIALVAMLLRALLPTGWMPNNTGGPAPLIVCTGTGLVAITFDKDGTPLKRTPIKSDATHRGICPFGAVAHLAPPNADIAFVPPLRTILPVQAPQIYRAIFGEARHTLQTARAPPATA